MKTMRGIHIFQWKSKLIFRLNHRPFTDCIEYWIIYRLCLETCIGSIVLLHKCQKVKSIINPKAAMICDVSLDDAQTISKETKMTREKKSALDSILCCFFFRFSFSIRMTETKMFNNHFGCCFVCVGHQTVRVKLNSFECFLILFDVALKLGSSTK